MRYAVSIPPFTVPSTILDLAIAAEQVDGAWPVGDWVADLSGRIIDGPPR